jgi:hypothetical protein
VGIFTIFVAMHTGQKKSARSHKYLFYALLLALFAVGGCNHEERPPDVSNVKIALRTYRFDKDLYSIDTNRIGEGLQKLAAKYPDFLNYYLDTLMAYGIHGNYADSTKGIREGLRMDLTEKGHRALQDTIVKDYPGNDDLDKQLAVGFQYMKHYFPDYEIPKVIYLNLGLSDWPAFALDKTTFCIGLDMFLGPQYPYYAAIGVPDYMAAHLRKSYIPVSAFAQVYQSLYPFQAEDKPLLDLMIQRGKQQYFLHKVLPSTPDSVLFGFTQRQVTWCNSNEAVIYNFLIHERLLYNKELLSIHPYIYDGPFAKGLEAVTEPVKKSPGNIGTWLGYRIVASYMAQHPETSLKQLCDLKVDPTKFLEEARYKPK